MAQAPPPQVFFPYFATLTQTDGFSDADCVKVADWCRNKSEECLLVKEDHMSGKKHLHFLATLTCKQTVQVTRMLKRLYATNGWPCSAGVSIVVKKATDKIGLFHYLTKDLNGSPPLLIIKWRMTWIQEQCKANLKKVPLKMLSKDGYIVGMKTASELICQYATRTGMPLSGKPSYIQVVMAMQAESYKFHNCKHKQLYCQVMSVCGNHNAMRSFLEGELSFLE